MRFELSVAQLTRIWKCRDRRVRWRNRLLVAIAALVLTLGLTSSPVAPNSSNFATNSSARRFFVAARLENGTTETRLPPLNVHPLPEKLALWDDRQETGDYFDAIAPHSAVGFLVWSAFPVSVYIQPPNSDRDRRSPDWYEAVQSAITEWNDYFPLVQVGDRETADIVCLRSRPPLRATLNRETRQLEIPTARTAEASYEFYLSPDDPPLLSHRFTLHLSSHQTDEQIRSAARHELGHALGIWGHSPHQTDVLYATQVSNPPPISVRDVNTLKKVYQQPTRLGWEVLAISN